MLGDNIIVCNVRYYSLFRQTQAVKALARSICRLCPPLMCTIYKNCTACIATAASSPKPPTLDSPSTSSARCSR